MAWKLENCLEKRKANRSWNIPWSLRISKKTLSLCKQHCLMWSSVFISNVNLKKNHNIVQNIIVGSSKNFSLYKIVSFPFFYFFNFSGLFFSFSSQFLSFVPNVIPLLFFRPNIHPCNEIAMKTIIYHTFLALLHFTKIALIVLKKKTQSVLSVCFSFLFLLQFWKVLWKDAFRI